VTRNRSDASCRQCGAAAHGKFCSNCGASLAGAAVARTRPPTPRSMQALVATTVMLAAFVVFLIGQRVSAGPTPAAAGSAPDQAAIPDISQMTPVERASRLFDRVMMYDENGYADSARFFAPMAIQAYEMLGALDAHSRYDIGMVELAAGDSVAARARADTILASRPAHLLGLALAMRSAPGPGARAAFARRLTAAAATEKANPLPEYGDHATDVERAIASARNPVP